MKEQLHSKTNGMKKKAIHFHTKPLRLRDLAVKKLRELRVSVVPPISKYLHKNPYSSIPIHVKNTPHYQSTPPSKMILKIPRIQPFPPKKASDNKTMNYKVGNESLIKVLDNASSHLRNLLEKQGRPEGALKIAVIGGGCSGLQYQMDLVDGPRDRDILVESNQVNVVTDPKSALFITGSELDYSSDLQQGGFKVTNPNAEVTCSCGESFSA